MSKTRKTLRLIGDVHGRYHEFFPLTHDTDYVLQVGDLGLDYKPFAGIDPVRIRCLAGNHDVYQQVSKQILSDNWNGKHSHRPR